MGYRIMIVEDDYKIAQHLLLHMEKYGYTVFVPEKFNNILAEFESFQPDLVFMDINLPHFDGFYWCRQIRTESTCPIIFISARTGEMDQVRALENGADDYITKPFHPDVVVAKVRSHLRRAYGEYSLKQQERVLDIDGLKLYPERLELCFLDNLIKLTKNERDIIEYLMERYPRIAGREDLLMKLWDDELYVDENTLNVNVTRVRKKFQELGISEAIETVRGAGYRLNISWE